MPTPPRLITDWTVEYGQGPLPVKVPHAWRQEVDVRWEGPAVYETAIEVPPGNWWIVFHGVSYAAKVFLDGELAGEHHGIWDAFSVPLSVSASPQPPPQFASLQEEGEASRSRSSPSPHPIIPSSLHAPAGTSTPKPPPPPGQEEGDIPSTSPLEGEVGKRSEPGEGVVIAIRVEVTKNGGATYPVRDVASGFLPFVFNTFGGIFKEVELVESDTDPMLGIWGVSQGESTGTPLPRQASGIDEGGAGGGRSGSPPHPLIPSSLHTPAGTSAPQPPPPGHEAASSPSSPFSPTHTLTDSPPPCRVTVKGTKIFVDGKPFYLRAPLTWGWYPEFGHTNPDEETVRKEVRQMKSMGFNTCKFCLWVPHHRYFEILEEEGMFAWLELPLWDPTPDPEKQEAMFEELRRIVLEYRRHSNIIVWTCGCELSSNTSAEYRERLYKMVKELTGAALVKDNSGGSEMYGGDLREFGDFYDFHPYCDLPFYPLVLDSLMVGPRKKMPILLGEFNDYDVHRDLARLKRERPFWTSQDPYLNDQGSRWDKPELPRILDESRFALDPGRSRDEALHAYSLAKSDFIRGEVHDSVRGLSDIAGFVVTSWRQTPIASSAFVDDRGEQVHRSDPYEWNAEESLFLIPNRRPPWIHGGNRPGWIDGHNFFPGEVSWKIGASWPEAANGDLHWEIQDSRCETLAEGSLPCSCGGTFDAQELCQISWAASQPGPCTLSVDFEETYFFLEFTVYQKPDFSQSEDWSLHDPEALTGLSMAEGKGSLVATEVGLSVRAVLETGGQVVLLLHGPKTRPMPYWRECIAQWKGHPILAPFEKNWHAQLAFSGDRVIDLDALQEAVGKLDDVEVLINRIDTRTYREDPILIRAKVGKGTLVATTLRPYGGLGIQPVGVMNNPAGAALLESLIKLAEER